MIYHDDMYVEHAFSVETADASGNLRWWVDQRVRATTVCAATPGSSTACSTLATGDELGRCVRRIG